ncbi:hypothetical protein K461DRAFT_249025 [Myriangium duriaei CBS 260.36]|uniref:Uncharacterized protein n=1 Tax=Myriangium duriaei CBS 260.36 TaxID=1168546 RepID=A0A9P4MNW4_9PEZI|nr:hypothetical protein K461DRAFT_249025 [Myriangium duriaei CBS 260.36]
MQQLDLLVLGAGWTSTFLTPLLDSSSLSYALTSTTGRPSTIKFKFDPSLSDQSYFSVLPSARYILVTFPVRDPAHANLLLASYAATHPRADPRYIVLGSTGIWPPGGPTFVRESCWVTRHSPYDTTNDRARAEEAYLEAGAAVLNLSGLWDGVLRIPRRWVERVAKDKEGVKGKGSLHMIHGVDVARSIVAADDEGKRCKGQRWMLTDGFVYDWWALIAGWADAKEDGEVSEHCRWVFELMSETGTRALPRSMEALGRCYDTREFWEKFELVPLKGRIF